MTIPTPTSATGTAWERAPWHATQRAAWEALRKPGMSIDNKIVEGGCTSPSGFGFPRKPIQRSP
jgi:hypothetical protein